MAQIDARVVAMGRQINFWMTESDELAFVEKLNTDDLVWTYYNLKANQDPHLYEFDQWTLNNAGQRLVIIRRSDWDKLEWTTRVGTGASPSFEWDTCKRGADYIQRGRIYFRTDWLDGDCVHVKPEEPTRWFDRLVSWLRRRGRKWEYPRQFLMPDAAKALDNNLVKITYFDPPSSTKTTDEEIDEDTSN